MLISGHDAVGGMAAARSRATVGVLARAELPQDARGLENRAAGSTRGTQQERRGPSDTATAPIAPNAIPLAASSRAAPSHRSVSQVAISSAPDSAAGQALRA
jgi:hypothetical protein